MKYSDPAASLRASIIVVKNLSSTRHSDNFYFCTSSDILLELQMIIFYFAAGSSFLARLLKHSFRSARLFGAKV